MKFGLTTGCWDLFHGGHDHLLRAAAKQCDWLIVAVNRDDWIKANKGAGRPFRPLNRRMDDVRNCGFSLGALRGGVGYARFTVIPFNGNDGDLARVIEPDVIFRGFDQSANFSTIPVVRICELPGISTTLLAAPRSLK